jgi:hypothetical protein
MFVIRCNTVIYIAALLCEVCDLCRKLCQLCDVSVMTYNTHTRQHYTCGDWSVSSEQVLSKSE